MSAHHGFRLPRKTAIAIQTAHVVRLVIDIACIALVVAGVFVLALVATGGR